MKEDKEKTDKWKIYIYEVLALGITLIIISMISHVMGLRSTILSQAFEIMVWVVLTASLIITLYFYRRHEKEKDGGN